MRLSFMGETKYDDNEVKDNCIVIKDYSEIETINGWKNSFEINIGDIIIANEDEKEEHLTVIKTDKQDNNIIIYVEER